MLSGVYICNSIQPKDTYRSVVYDLCYSSSSRFYPCWVTLKFWKVTNKGMGLFWTLGKFWVFVIVWLVVCCKLTATNIFPCEKLKLNFFLIDYIYNPGVLDWAQGNLCFPTVMGTEHWHRLSRWAMAYPSIKYIHILEILKNHLDVDNWLLVDLLEQGELEDL